MVKRAKGSGEQRVQENKGVRRTKGSEEQRGQESGRAVEDKEDGDASPPFIGPLILLLYPNAQPVL